MFSVYILKSLRDGELYIGSTNNISKRLAEHDDGKVISTRSRRPFRLVYCESYLSEKDARHRESNLKLRSRAYAQLKKRLEDSFRIA